MELSIVYRVLHIAATCTSLGGLFYARAVLWPTLDSLPEPERQPFLQKMIRRYAAIKWSGVAVIVITGILQWIAIYPAVDEKNPYLLYFAIKMIGAVGLFTITALLALPNQALSGMQRRRGLWSAINVFCGVLILTGAALMRSVHS